MVVGSIWLVDARDGRSMARSSARLQGVIGEGERRIELVARW
jgi:hypothetical protein